MSAALYEFLTCANGSRRAAGRGRVVLSSFMAELGAAADRFGDHSCVDCANYARHTCLHAIYKHNVIHQPWPQVPEFDDTKARNAKSSDRWARNLECWLRRRQIRESHNHSAQPSVRPVRPSVQRIAAIAIPAGEHHAAAIHLGITSQPRSISSVCKING